MTNTITLYPDENKKPEWMPAPDEEDVDHIAEDIFLFSGLKNMNAVKAGVLYLFALEITAYKEGFVQINKPVAIRDIWDTLVDTYKDGSQKEYIDEFLKTIENMPNLIL